MAIISIFNITKVETDRVNFDYDYEKEVYNIPQFGGAFREEWGHTWVFSVEGRRSLKSPCFYEKGGTGTTLYTLKAELTCTYSEGYYIRNEDSGTLEKIYWEENVIETKTDSLTFYPCPDDFIFNNCVAGKTWNIKEGISSLITNIEDFYQSAQQWKSWKYQSAATICPSFTDAEGYLAASSLNNVYNYVGLGMPWKSGDYISAAMFNDLAERIKQ